MKPREILLIVYCALRLMACGTGNSGHYTASSASTLGGGGGVVAIAPNGNTVVVGGALPGSPSRVFIGMNGLTPQAVGTVGGPNYGALSLTAAGDALYLNLESEGHTSGSQYQSTIWRSSDNGVTWQVVAESTDGVVLFGHKSTISGTKIAVGLWHVPQSGGYMAGSVDFGWFDTATNCIEIVGRLATAGVEQASFPSEVFIYEIGSKLVAGVRWGEYPVIPWIKPMISNDGGHTWTLSSAIWPGKAGLVGVCVTDNGEWWADGYDKPGAAAFSAVWRFDPVSLQILETYHPFGNSTVWFQGNGGIACKGNNVMVVLGNGVLTYVSFTTN